ncbi:MAG: glycosyltransferase family 1 protein, partial [Thermoprotei archaeon]
IYLGYIPEDDKIALIDAAEAVVLPSKHAGESYPLLLDEVLARGKLVVMTVRSKILEFRTKFYERNIITSLGNAKSLAHTITNLLLKNKKSALTGNRVSDEIGILSWNIIARRLVKLYDQVIRR